MGEGGISAMCTVCFLCMAICILLGNIILSLFAYQF